MKITQSKPVQIDWLESAIQRIVIARDMCGDEKEALNDCNADAKQARGSFFSQAEKQAIRNGVAREWAACQRAAGVTKPISPGERVSINRSIEAESVEEELF